MEQPGSDGGGYRLEAAEVRDIPAFVVLNVFCADFLAVRPVVVVALLATVTASPAALFDVVSVAFAPLDNALAVESTPVFTLFAVEATARPAVSTVERVALAVLRAMDEPVADGAGLVEPVSRATTSRATATPP